jgi:hypothetical protein
MAFVGTRTRRPTRTEEAVPSLKCFLTVCSLSVAHVPAAPLLLIALLLLTFPLLLLLIGLPKHYLRRSRDQGKAKQKHGCLPGLSKCGGNHREKNGLMRQTFRHSCWFGVNDVAFDEGFRKTLRENRSRDTLHNRLGAALHRKVLRNNVNVRSD